MSTDGTSVRNAVEILPGLTDPVHDAQAAFRGALRALSLPGTLQAVGQGIPGLGLGAAMAHLLLTLTDEDTPVWFPPADAAAAGWLRFHSGARTAADAGAAAFVAVCRTSDCPALQDLAAGTAESPERSATLLIEVPTLESGAALAWQGPGIPGQRTVRIGGLPADFWEGWHANHARFPQGVDVIFTCGDRAIGLPRTTRVSRVEGL